ISRYEDKVAKELRESTKDSGFEYSRDRMGSLIMNKKGNINGPKIQVAAHMDEVGFLVRDITDKGMIMLSMVGGVWPLTVIGTKAYVLTSTGERLEGVYGHTSIHILEAKKRTIAPVLNDLYVDIGVSTKKEAEALGVEPGDVVLMTGSTFMGANGDFVVGKAMDNRAGVTVIDQVVQRLKDKVIPNDLYIVGTVQEEVGTRGARTSVSMIKPDVAIAIDTCASHDTPGAIKGIQKLGDGIALRIKDGGTMMDPKLVSFLYKLAKKHKIPVYKFVAQGGGTDAEQLQYGEGGVATITLSIPQRYLHSPLGTCSLTDIQAGIDLIVEFALAFGEKEYDEITYK
ncbi:MAG: M42 family metallopeptidase, partial [Mycoplasmataceae bacterium]|nr:M42 family metallopeptidase [Mycoplasmataceae bacterium]